MLKTFIAVPPPEIANTADWRAADIGAANGHGNARSLVRILSSISLGGTANGIRLLRPETVEKIFEVQCEGPDVVLLNHPVRWGLGYALPQRESFPFVPDGKICYVGRLGRIVGDDEPRPPGYRGICHEQDVARCGRFTPYRPLLQADLRGLRLIPERQRVEHVETHGR